MGHTSKFTFPLPGWRHKHQPSASSISAPLTKVQKLLGTEEVDVHPGPTPRDADKPWGAISTVDGSVDASETTANHADLRHELGILRGVPPSKFPDRSDVLENESAIIPRGIDGPADMAIGGPGNDVVTETSSLRRRTSTSTITSFYDKSKQPLSVSQQTSASAMAKGLPHKAHALLDIGGESAPPSPPRKKPSRLDLSLARVRGRARAITAVPLAPSQAQAMGLNMLGDDLEAPSPSVRSTSLQGTPSSHHREERQPSRKLSWGSLRDESLRRKGSKGSVREDQPRLVPRSIFHLRSPAQPPPPHYDAVTTFPTSGRSLRSAKAAKDLHNLYDHYEQRTLQDILEQDMPDPEVVSASGLQLLIPDYQTPPASSTTQLFRSSVSSISNPISPLTAPDTPSGTATESSKHNSASFECDASISSRHTRTSKASKRTDQSMNDIDLRMTSVLSLSSDSEDDAQDPPAPHSLSPPGSLQRNPAEGQGSPKSVRSWTSRQSTSSQRPGLPKTKRYLTIPEAATTGAHAPKINTRTSSLLQTMSAAIPPADIRTSRRTASLSTSTVQGVSNGQSKAPTQHVAHAIRMFPTEEHLSARSAAQAAGERQIAHQRRPSARTVDESIRPTSPTSVDFYPQSRRASSNSYDGRSVRSGHSAGDGESRRGSTASTGSARLMAVTRQEEKLLAAMRMKRARIREDMISEFGEHVADGEELARECISPRAVHPPQHEQTQPAHPHHERRRDLDRWSSSTAGKTSRHASVDTVVGLNPRPRLRVITNAPTTSPAPSNSSAVMGDTAGKSPASLRPPPPRPACPLQSAEVPYSTSSSVSRKGSLQIADVAAPSPASLRAPPLLRSPRSEEEPKSASSVSPNRLGSSVDAAAPSCPRMGPPPPRPPRSDEGCYPEDLEKILLMFDRPVGNLDLVNLAGTDPIERDSSSSSSAEPCASSLVDSFPFRAEGPGSLVDSFPFPAESPGLTDPPNSASVPVPPPPTPVATVEAAVTPHPRHPSRTPRVALSAFPMPSRGGEGKSRVAVVHNNNNTATTTTTTTTRRYSPNANVQVAKPPAQNDDDQVPRYNNNNNKRLSDREEEEEAVEEGIPRPDSPVSTALAVPQQPVVDPVQYQQKLNKAKVRLSAVGGLGMGPGGGAAGW